MHPAWYAGIFDGEGHIGLFSSRGSPLVRVNVTNTHKPTIDKFARFGGGVWVGKCSAKRKTKLYRWGVSGRGAIKFLRIVYPHLVTKKKQVDVMLWLYKRVPVVRGEHQWVQHSKIVIRAKQKLALARKERK